MAKEKGSVSVIPYVKAVRVGNYKLWRSRSRDMEQVNVSDLAGTWKVCIPQTAGMYSTICNGYNTTDEKLREQFLCMLFTNMSNICLTPSEALHDALFFLTEMMSFPYLLLSEKEMEKRMKSAMKTAGIEKAVAKDHISKMMDYRLQLYELIEKKKDAFIAEYERQQAEHLEPTEKELEQDALADEAVKILNEEGGD